MTQAGRTDTLDTIPLFDVKIPLTPARAAAIRRALAALDEVPGYGGLLRPHLGGLTWAHLGPGRDGGFLMVA